VQEPRNGDVSFHILQSMAPTAWWKFYVVPNCWATFRQPFSVSFKFQNLPVIYVLYRHWNTHNKIGTTHKLGTNVMDSTKCGKEHQNNW